MNIKENRTEPSSSEALKGASLLHRYAHIGRMDVVESQKVVPETLFGNELQIEVLGVLETLNGGVGGAVARLVGQELKSGNAEEAEPYGLLQCRREIEVGGGKEGFEPGPESLERDTGLAFQTDFFQRRRYDRVHAISMSESISIFLFVSIVK